MAYNMQRLCFREGTQGDEPALPREAVSWILDGRACESIRVAGCWVPTSEPVRENYAVFGSNGTFLPRRYVQAGPVVLFVAWGHPQVPESTELIHRQDCDRIPAISVSHPAGERVFLPAIGDSSILLKGLAAMPDIAAKLLERLNKLPES